MGDAESKITREIKMSLYEVGYTISSLWLWGMIIKFPPKKENLRCLWNICGIKSVRMRNSLIREIGSCWLTIMERMERAE